MTEMDNLFKKKIKNKMNRFFVITSDHDATLKQVLESLEERKVSEAQQLNLLNKLENDIERLFDITSHNTDLIEKQDRDLYGYKEVNKTLTANSWPFRYLRIKHRIVRMNVFGYA